MKKLSLIILLVVLSATSGFAETDIALLYGSSHVNTAWSGGPEGKMIEGDDVWRITLWAKTNSIKLFWKLEPMIKVTYDEGEFDFSSPFAPTQEIHFKTVSGYIGFNRPLTWEWVDNIYLLGGGAYVFDMGLDMVEANGLVHGGTPTQFVPAINIGINKIFPLYKSLKAIAEFDVTVYPVAIGFDRCRKVRRDNLNTWVSLGILW